MHRARSARGAASARALAKQFGCSRTRVTQVLDLLNLHPHILEHVEGPDEEKRGKMTERALRPLANLPPEKQLAGFESLVPGNPPPRVFRRAILIP